MSIPLNRETRHCRSGQPHLSDYFAGACDGIMGRATPDTHDEFGISVPVDESENPVLGKLTIHFVKNNSSAVGMNSADITNVSQDEADGFAEEFRVNRETGAYLAVITVTNEQGSYVSVKTSDIFMVTFEAYV